MPIDLDPRFTFDAFVVGPANRLAVAAARRVADSPGATYNPLFIYSGSGLGKTHLLGAIGEQLRRVHDPDVVYETLEHLIEQLSRAVQTGELDGLRGQLRSARVLLLDDVQFLAGQHQIQEELLRAWDALATRGAQVVLSSDRPPQEIDGLDDRLLSRLSGGLIVDMSPPDFETRMAIVRRKAEERGIALGGAVVQALARIAFTNVRELQGALNRLVAVQELEGRTVSADEVPRLLGSAAERGHDEFGEFLSEISGTVSAVVAEADRQIGDAIMEWEGEGFRTRRLETALSGTMTAARAEALVRGFERDVNRLRAIEREIRELDARATELASPALRDPDRVPEADELLRTVRERQSPPPGPPDGPGLESLPGADTLAVRAARIVAERPGDAYNPLYVLGPPGSGKSRLLGALARTAAATEPDRVIGFVDATTFAEELVDALSRSRLDVWRARYRRAHLLVLEDVDQLEGAERAHEELFHLFEDLHRDGRQLVFSSTVPPAELPVPDRLRSRLEAGLVVELEEAPGADAAEPGGPTDPAGTVRPGTAPDVPGTEAVAGAPGATPARGARAASWLMSPEKVLWEWPYPSDWIEDREA